MLLPLLQPSSMLERKLLMAGFLEVQSLEAKPFLSLEQVQICTVSMNFQHFLSRKPLMYFGKSYPFCPVNYGYQHGQELAYILVYCNNDV